VGMRVRPGIDRVMVDGFSVEPAPEFLYIALNKPKGYLVSDSDPEGRPLAKDLLPDFSMRLFPVGRLDFQSEGLLLYTNDGVWANRISHPRNRVVKTYEVKVRNIPKPETLKQWINGVFDNGEKLKALSVRVIRVTGKNAWLEVILSGGVNRQVRRMGDATGHPVLKLIRKSIGNLELGNLKPGEFRFLNPSEIKSLVSRTAQKPPPRNRRSIRQASPRTRRRKK